MVIDAAGRPRELACTGTLLGVIDDPQADDATVELDPGDTLLLYTDGLTEAGAPKHTLSTAEVAALLVDARRDTAAQTAQGCLASALRAGGGVTRDDIAVLVVHVHGPHRPSPRPGGFSVSTATSGCSSSAHYVGGALDHGLQLPAAGVQPSSCGTSTLPSMIPSSSSVAVPSKAQKSGSGASPRSTTTGQRSGGASLGVPVEDDPVVGVRPGQQAAGLGPDAVRRLVREGVEEDVLRVAFDLQLALDPRREVGAAVQGRRSPRMPVP